MSKEQIIAEVNKLSETEISEVYNHIKGKVISDRKKHARTILDKVSGSGKGVWDMDAQEFVTQSRTDGRI